MRSGVFRMLFWQGTMTFKKALLNNNSLWKQDTELVIAP